MSHIKVNTQESIYSPDKYGGQITVWFDAKEDFEIFYKVINHLVEVTITPDKGIMDKVYMVRRKEDRAIIGLFKTLNQAIKEMNTAKLRDESVDSHYYVEVHFIQD